MAGGAGAGAGQPPGGGAAGVPGAAAGFARRWDEAAAAGSCCGGCRGGGGGGAGAGAGPSGRLCPACCGGAASAPAPARWVWVPLASTLRPAAAGGFLELRGVRAPPLSAPEAAGAGALWEERAESDVAQADGIADSATGSLTLRIAYSAAFRGPELQFEGVHADGRKMEPGEVLDALGAGGARSLEGIVRAGEHPASGALCLTLHGCQSPQIMRELMVGDAAWNIEENELSAERYLLAWFSLVSQPLRLGMPLGSFDG